MKNIKIKYIGTILLAGAIFIMGSISTFANEKEFRLVKIITDNNLITRGKGHGDILAYTYKHEEVFLNKIEDEWALVTNSNGTVEGYLPISAIGYELDNQGEDVVNRGIIREKQDAIILIAKSKLDFPYSYGSSGPDSFDCSGFVTYVMTNAAGISLPRTSAGMGSAGIAVSKAELQEGDLVLFNTNGNSSTINHAGIYIGDGKVIHSSSGSVRKVIISDINSGYYQNAYHSARRVL